MHHTIDFATKNLVDFDHIRALTLIIPNMLYYLAIVALIYPIIINLAAC